MVVNFVSTILIISIHYQSNRIIPEIDYFNWNYLIQEFIVNGIARVSVPSFSFISGYYLFLSLGRSETYFKMIKKRSKTILIPYLACSMIIFLLSALIDWVFNTEIIHEINLISIIRNIIIKPISIQFWFLRDLIILLIISPLILIKNKKVSFVAGMIFAVLWLFEIQPFPKVSGWYLINIEVLFFFWIGGYISQYKYLLINLFNLKKIYKVLIILLWVLLIFIRIYIEPGFYIWYNENTEIPIVLIYKFAILTGVISLFIICSQFKKAMFIIYLSGYTFFAYVFHFQPLFLFTGITPQFIELQYNFYINFPIAVAIVFSLAYLISKFFPKLYSLITGGRTPQKALNRLNKTIIFNPNTPPIE